MTVESKPLAVELIGEDTEIEPGDEITIGRRADVWSDGDMTLRALRSPYGGDDTSLPEIPLLGGDVTEGVVRVGDTVRRPIGPNGDLIHALLLHLDDVGFDGAPRFLGIDSADRAVLTYIAGEVAGRPRPPWIADEHRLVSVGRLLRAFDDAAITFVVPDGVTIDPGFTDTPDLPPVPPYEPELIGHRDITPENVVFRDGRAFALIDFDLIGPATRVDEIINALRYWGPIADPQDVDPLMRDVDAVRRCRLFADAYEMSGDDRAKLVEVATMRLRRSWHLMRQRAEIDGGGWLRMWQEGVGDQILRAQRWLDAHGPAIESALMEP